MYKYKTEKNIKIKEIIFNNCSNIHKAEEYCILTALKTFKTLIHLDSIVVFTDSYRALETITLNSEYIKLFNHFKKNGVSIKIRKIKAHSGLKLNELADKIAKRIGKQIQFENHYKKGQII